MNDAQKLANNLNGAAKAGAFSFTKARATARKDDRVDWQATKSKNADFNPDVDGCESFVMRDGSICQWMPGQYRYAAQSA